MLRPLVSYTDLAERHGHRPALQVLRQLEQLAEIESDDIVSFDLDARFERALRTLASTCAAIKHD